MKSTAVIFRSELLEHELGTSHPFRSRERLTLYLKLLEEFGMLGDFAGVKVVEPELTATDEDILAVHDLSLLEKIKRLSESGGVLDADTPVPARTYERARIQIGGSIYGAKLVLDGSFARAVQCLTLGGHHATSRHTGRSFGFCYFNQQAVVIRHLQREGYVNRVLVLDCDAHHGNGIQEIFYEDPDLLYISLHQDPRTLYPGTGFFWEQGEGRDTPSIVPFPPEPSAVATSRFSGRYAFL